jgi:hypothetical protein
MERPVITTQRWRERRDFYRRATEKIRPAEYDAAPLVEREAKAFVIRHHYSKSYPAARFRFGLYRRGELAGVAVFSVPCRSDILSIFPGRPLDSVELGRFVLLDEVPGNGETFFLGRCFSELRARGLTGVLAFSDPHPRETDAGRTIFAGHLGVIYQAHNARYLGRGSRRTLRLLPDGRVFSARAISKIRSADQGWRYSAAILEGIGARPLAGSDPREWLASELPRLTRTIRHPGNHRYAWTLQRRHRAHLAPVEPYPKRLAA